MKILGVWIFLGCAVLANCLGGQQAVLLAIENYVSGAGAETRTNCIKESGVPLEVLEGSEKSGIMASDKRLNCYLKCSFRNSKFVNEKEVLSMDVMKSILKASSPEFLKKVEAKCIQPTTTDMCDAALDTTVCVLTMAHEEHIMED